MSTTLSSELPIYFNIIIALGPNNEFGCVYKDGTKGMPWGYIKEDLEYFKKITTTDYKAEESKLPNIVIMGRNTFETLKKPLGNRINIVISSTRVITNKLLDHVEDNTKEIWVNTFEDALKCSGQLVKNKSAGQIFIIGGSRLIAEACIKYYQYIEYFYLTRIIHHTQSSTETGFLNNPNIKEIMLLYNLNPSIFNTVSHKKVSTSNKDNEKFDLNFYKYSFIKSNQESKYLNLLSTVLSTGKVKKNRTGIDTLSSWGEQIKIDMINGKFPLFTTKRVFFRGVVEELLFFISGKTQTKVLEDKKVYIWKGNTTKEFLNKSSNQYLNKLDEGDMGKGYGFQWRHFGMQTTPNEQLEIGQGGIDQLKKVIDDIKRVKIDPTISESRRLIVTAWNPMDLDKQALPCCHNMFQFGVEPDKEGKQCLNISVNMRSCDLGCGLPFNVSSYALLTFMICNLTDLTPGTLVINIADAHIYSNHIQAIKEQISRPIRDWPTLKILGEHKTIDDFTSENFLLENYYPHPEIKMEMAV